MKKKIIFCIVLLTLIFSMFLTSTSLVFADETNTVYYLRNSAENIATLTIESENNYSCVIVYPDGETMNLSGEYIEEDGNLKFMYGSVEVFTATINDNNSLIFKDWEQVESPTVPKPPIVTDDVSPDNDEAYIYQDESATSVFTLKDETNYECKVTAAETGDTIDVTGTYIKQGNRIIFYLAGEVLLEAEVGEDNTLTMVDSETPQEPILPDTEELEEVKDIEQYTAQIVEWIIAGVLGLLGTSAAAIAFRKHLKSLIKSVSTALGLLKTNKDTAEEDIKNIKGEAEKTLASLKTVKEEMRVINKAEFEAMQKQIGLLGKVIMYMVGGMKELVANGTSESVCDLLRECNKEVNKNESEEIQ